METTRKNQIDNAFLEAYIKVCTNRKVPLCQSTILAKFSKNRDILFQFCRKDKVHCNMDLEDFFNAKMVGLGMSKESIIKLLLCIHFAFTKEKSIENERISLIIYYSQVAGCICIGILEDNTPQRTLKISDIFEAMSLGNEQNN